MVGELYAHHVSKWCYKKEQKKKMSVLKSNNVCKLLLSFSLTPFFLARDQPYMYHDANTPLIHPLHR